MDPVTRAIERYDRRQHGWELPAGKRDATGRWKPTGSERQVCCEGWRTPLPGFPLTLWKHCHSVTHVARLERIAPASLRSALARRSPLDRPAATAPDICFQCFVPGCPHLSPAAVDEGLVPVPHYRSSRTSGRRAGDDLRSVR